MNRCVNIHEPMCGYTRTYCECTWTDVWIYTNRCVNVNEPMCGYTWTDVWMYMNRCVDIQEPIVNAYEPMCEYAWTDVWMYMNRCVKAQVPQWTGSNRRNIDKQRNIESLLGIPEPCALQGSDEVPVWCVLYLWVDLLMVQYKTLDVSTDSKSGLLRWRRMFGLKLCVIVDKC